MDGILSVSLHVGNSDVISEFVYDSSKELLDIIAAIKQIAGADRVMWSEEVEEIITIIIKIIKNNNYNYTNMLLFYFVIHVER